MSETMPKRTHRDTLFSRTRRLKPSIKVLESIDDVSEDVFHHSVNCKYTLAVGYPLGGDYRSESKTVARLGRMFDGDGVDGRLPFYLVYARHFAVAIGEYAEFVVAELTGAGLGGSHLSVALLLGSILPHHTGLVPALDARTLFQNAVGDGDGRARGWSSLWMWWVSVIEGSYCSSLSMMRARRREMLLNTCTPMLKLLEAINADPALSTASSTSARRSAQPVEPHTTGTPRSAERTMLTGAVEGW